MTDSWRKNNLRGDDDKKLNEWVRVPVGSKKEDNDIVPSNPCIAGSLFQVSKFMKLKKHQNKMMNLMTTSSPWYMIGMAGMEYSVGVT